MTKRYTDTSPLVDTKRLVRARIKDTTKDTRMMQNSCNACGSNFKFEARRSRYLEICVNCAASLDRAMERDD